MGVATERPVENSGGVIRLALSVSSLASDEAAASEQDLALRLCGAAKQPCYSQPWPEGNRSAAERSRTEPTQQAPSTDDQHGPLEYTASALPPMKQSQ